MLWFLRIFFAGLCAYMGWHLVKMQEPDPVQAWLVVGAIGGGLTAFIIIGMELVLVRRFIATLSIFMFGLVFGFIVSYLVITALFAIPIFEGVSGEIRQWLQFSLTAIFCYLSAIGILQCRDEFKFVIPFFELARGPGGHKPVLLDTSVIIDGRIAELLASPVLEGPLVVPRFVLGELQQLADSADRIKRNRGRRGLEILNRLRQGRKIEIQEPDTKLPHIEGVDNKLVCTAKRTGARLMTVDFNLGRVAQVEGVEVVNLHELAQAFRPVVLPGEVFEVKLIRQGEEPGQAVGYLGDGTMVVVEGAANRIGQSVSVGVTNLLQTSAGRMIFGQYRGEPEKSQGQASDLGPQEKGERSHLHQTEPRP